MKHVHRVHDGVIANPRPCPKCDYVADRPSTLSRHFIARHTAYGCPHGYKSVQGSLGRHLKEKHRHNRKRYVMLNWENDTLPHNSR
jgi:hypothetical protein